MGSQFHKDEALESLSIAEKALKEGNAAKAEKFALKAKNICDCPEVNVFLRKLASSFTAGTSNAGPSLRQRAPKDHSTRNEKEESQAVTPTISVLLFIGFQGTDKQKQLIRQIKHAKDFYETLNVPKDAKEDEIKRAYKKLALQLHPDKCKAAGAEEAFKAVSRSFACLSDPEKRQNYDQFGNENGQSVERSTRYRREFYADEIDPEEIFNMFFGGSFPARGGVYFNRTRHPFYRRTRNESAQRETQTNPLTGLFSLLPLILVVLLTYFSGEKEDFYMFYREHPYVVEMSTWQNSVPFYVKSKVRFDTHFPPNSRQRLLIEQQIEEQVRTLLASQCREEKRRKRRLQNWRKEEAERMALPSCDRLKEIFYPNPKTVTA